MQRDVFQSCTEFFHHLFHFMEDEMILNIENEAHLFFLHYVFPPCINRALDLFAGALHNHAWFCLYVMYYIMSIYYISRQTFAAFCCWKDLKLSGEGSGGTESSLFIECSSSYKMFADIQLHINNDKGPFSYLFSMLLWSEEGL